MQHLLKMILKLVEEEDYDRSGMIMMPEMRITNGKELVTEIYLS